MLERYITLSDICQYNRDRVFGTSSNAIGNFSEKGVDYELLASRKVLPPAPSHLDDFYLKDIGVTLLIEDINVLYNETFEAAPSVIPLLANVNKVVVSIPYEGYKGEELDKPNESIIRLLRSIALLKMDGYEAFSLIFDNIFLNTLYIALAVSTLTSFMNTGIQLDQLLLSLPILIAFKQGHQETWDNFLKYLDTHVSEFILVEAFAPAYSTYGQFASNSSKMETLIKELAEFFESTSCNIIIEKAPPCVNWVKQVFNYNMPYLELKFTYYTIRVPKDAILAEFVNTYINLYKKTGNEYMKELLDMRNTDKLITIIAPQKSLELMASSPYLIKHASFYLQKYDKECKKNVNIIQNQMDYLTSDILLPTETKLSFIKDALKRIPVLKVYYLYVQCIEQSNVTFVGEGGETDGTYLGEDVAAVMQLGFFKYKELKGKGLNMSNYNFFF